MEFALFWGCKIPYFVNQYETSTRAVLGELGIGIVDIEFTCCGYPVRNIHFQSFVLQSARNLALAEKQGVSLLTPCKCCYGSLKKVDFLMKEKISLREEINALLQEEGLSYQGGVEVKHLLTALFHDVGLDAVKERIIKPFKDLKIATHYGCHALRPANVTQFDDPLNPTKFDQLVEATGAESVDWPMKLQCCGNPLWGKNDELSKDLAEKKLKDGKAAGAHYMCVACTYCQIQFDTVQKEIIAERNLNPALPSILYPQLLGLSMGIDEKSLGIHKNELNGEGILQFLAEPTTME